MQRSYYSAQVSKFFNDDPSYILGELTRNHQHDLEDLQRNAWIRQVEILKNNLNGFDEGHVFWELSIPRMGKRADIVLLYQGIVFVIEFKVGAQEYDRHAINQAIDYAVDLKNFHQGSHNLCIVPILVSTEAIETDLEISLSGDGVSNCLCANKSTLSKQIQRVLECKKFASQDVDAEYWEKSGYKPTPTIIQAAQALYRGHSVDEISRSDAGAKNLSTTSQEVSNIIENSKNNGRKSICIITGVPGAGKTLAGLNIANTRMNAGRDEHAVFLSGNGPLVDVLREALARDDVRSGGASTKTAASSKAKTFIQNIHHFRDDSLVTVNAPVEKVVVFDEAQRAWDKKEASSFMSKKKGVSNFDKSEPEFLIEVMDRHNDWCTIICLIGGGQEINRGEAGLKGWTTALQERFSHWDVYYSDKVAGDEYVQGNNLKEMFSGLNAVPKEYLHLGVSIRSFRAEALSDFVHSVIDFDQERASVLYEKIRHNYPIYITRDLTSAKRWLKQESRGNEQFGIISSSGAIRLKPEGLHVKNKIDVKNWFLNEKDDVRSSFFLEDVATEFDVQGLELDRVCVAWGADFRVNSGKWQYFSFKGTKWQNIKAKERIRYLENSYRVLLTRARQGMVLFIPKGCNEDHTRPPEFYNETYEFLLACGIDELD